MSNAQLNQLGVLGDRLELLRKQQKELRAMAKALREAAKGSKGSKGGGSGDVKLKEEDKAKAMGEAAKAALDKAKGAVEKAGSEEAKIAATQAMERAKEMQRKARAAAAAGSHLFAKTPSEEQVTKRVAAWAEKIKKLEQDISNKDENKEVALGTSKTNYMDPRLTVAWCKRCEVPIDRVFAKTLRDKFVWAMFVPPDWQFEAQQ